MAYREKTEIISKLYKNVKILLFVKIHNVFFQNLQPIQRFCVFCENNNQPDYVVRSHSVKDSYGRVLCPKLRVYVCPICHVSGDYAHTIKYCPQKPIITMEDTVKFESTKLTKSFFNSGMKL